MITKLAKSPGTTSGEAIASGVVYVTDATGNNIWRIIIDTVPLAESGPKMVIEKVDSTDTVIATAPRLVLDLGTNLLQDFAAAADPTDKTIELRETKGCDESGTACYALVLRSKFYYTPIGSDFT